MASIISSLKHVSALMLAGDILCFKNNFICFIAMIRQLNGGKLGSTQLIMTSAFVCI